MNHASLRVALFLSAAILSAPQALADSDQPPGETVEPPEFGLLKVAPGVDTVYYSCAVCHSERIIAQQGMSRAEWSDLLDWMVEEQGMNEIEEPDLTEILDYLEAYYNVDRPNFPHHFPTLGGGG